MQIYLFNEKKFKGVINVCLNEIKIFKFSVNLSEFDALIISSKNALKALKVNKIKLDKNLQVYAVGESSAKSAFKSGFINVKIPSKFYAFNLFNEFKDELKTKKCLYLKAKELSSKLDEKLLENGVNLTQIIAYENIYKPLKISFKSPSIYIFCAPSSVMNFFKEFELKKEDKLIAIGEKTAASLKEFVDEKKILLPKVPSVKECVSLARKLQKN